MLHFNSKIVFITISTTNLLKRRIYKLTINKCLSTIHFIIFKIAWSFCSVLKVFNLRPVWISFVGWLMKYRPQMMINHIIRNMKENNSQKINTFILFNIFCDSHMYTRLFLINTITLLYFFLQISHILQYKFQRRGIKIQIVKDVQNWPKQVT